MKLLCTICLIFTYLAAFCGDKNETSILKVLSEQAAAWNRGDIESYMKGYWNHDSLVFIGSKGPVYGYNATLQRYKSAYTDTVKMGKLFFSDIKLKKLSSRYYFVSGRWELRRSIGDLSGFFTLIFQKFSRDWFIVADHSS